MLLATFAIFPLIGYQIACHGIPPVEEMATTARHISSTNLQERILPEGYPFELASLASTFNQMPNRPEESFERISRFSADIAHDLRTPVNNIREEAEVALACAQRRRISRCDFHPPDRDRVTAYKQTQLIQNATWQLLHLASACYDLRNLRRGRGCRAAYLKIRKLS